MMEYIYHTIMVRKGQTKTIDPFFQFPYTIFPLIILDKHDASNFSLLILLRFYLLLRIMCCTCHFAPVAQLDRAVDSGSTSVGGSNPLGRARFD